VVLAEWLNWSSLIPGFRELGDLVFELFDLLKTLAPLFLRCIERLLVSGRVVEGTPYFLVTSPGFGTLSPFFLFAELATAM